jgi:hypothetical protein
MELNITPEEVLAEQIEYLRIEPEPSVEDGWLPFTYIANNSTDMSRDALREYYNRKVREGVAEKKRWGKNVYYRIIPQTETHQEDN